MKSLFTEGIASRSFDQNLKYIFGRFYTVRKLRRIYLRLFRIGLSYSSCNQPLDSSHIKLSAAPSIILSQLKEDSFSAHVSLSKELQARLLLLINSSTSISHDRRRKPISVHNAMLYNSYYPADPFLIIDHSSPELDLLALNIAQSSSLIPIVEEYLGGITRIKTRVQTSLPCIASDEYREHNFQTVTYHYDVGGFSFLYLFFYLTDCDNLSGAHQLIPGSHKTKSIKTLFSSARLNTHSVYKLYGNSSSHTIEGCRGTGFFEDTSCIHRALAPTSSKRLCLQIRYEG